MCPSGLPSAPSAPPPPPPPPKRVPETPQQPGNVWQLHQSSCTPVRAAEFALAPFPHYQSSGNSEPQLLRTHTNTLMTQHTHTNTHPNYLIHTLTASAWRNYLLTPTWRLYDGLLLWAGEFDTGTCSHTHDKKFNTPLILLSQICIMIALQCNIAPAAAVFKHIIIRLCYFWGSCTNQLKVDLVTEPVLMELCRCAKFHQKKFSSCKMRAV